MIGLLAFNGLVIDYGVLWLARRQAQNAADAGRHGGGDPAGILRLRRYPAAKKAAVDAAKVNRDLGRRTWPDGQRRVRPEPCPPGSPGEGTPACIQVNVYRNQDLRQSAADVLRHAVWRDGARRQGDRDGPDRCGARHRMPAPMGNRRSMGRGPLDTPTDADDDWDMACCSSHRATSTCRPATPTPQDSGYRTTTVCGSSSTTPATQPTEYLAGLVQAD